ncbi:MAG: outer membrane beta-barrel protein [Cyclobacteriaceae bacterium]|nr:outer membrane beta-barrel protein [Cyclobacteriaceae bacterium]
MKKIIVIALIIGAAVTSSSAQSSFSIQYSIGFGGTVNKYVTSTSLRGATFEYKWYPQPNISIGIDGGWNYFYERRPYDSYTSGSLTLSGIQFRYAHAVPLFVTTSYYLSPSNKINPFVGVGVGTMFVSRYTDMGIYRISEEDWHFAMKPELGVRVDMSPDMDLIFGLRYNHAFATTDTSEQNYMTFNIGCVWK